MLVRLREHIHQYCQHQGRKGNSQNGLSLVVRSQQAKSQGIMRMIAKEVENGHNNKKNQPILSSMKYLSRHVDVYGVSKHDKLNILNRMLRRSY